MLPPAGMLFVQQEHYLVQVGLDTWISHKAGENYHRSWRSKNPYLAPSDLI